VRQLAVTDGRPQLVQQMLRQAEVDAGHEHICAKGFQLADAGAELFLILMIGHNFTG
jgi:hypothetical protein